jgi:hypothetical protein
LERLGLADIALAVAYAANESARLTFEPAREGVLSWNTFADRGLIEFRLLRAHAPATEWLPHAEWTTDGRKSFSPKHADVAVDVDVIRSAQPFDGIEVRAPGVDFSALYFATPEHTTPSLPYAAPARILDVPARSQFGEHGERGWCSPTALSMLNVYHGLDFDAATTARAVFDRAYNGTGNWSFNVAFSGSLGLRAAVVYLRNLDHAARFIDAGIPIAISYSWKGDELPGAPIEHSDGHLSVLCGFTENGDCAMNDPAAPNVRVVYPRGAIESIWQRNNGVAYAVAPAGLDFVSIVNS